MIAPGLFPPSFAHGGKVGLYFEAAAAIVVLVLLGQVLELAGAEQNRQCSPRPAESRAQDGAVVIAGEEMDVLWKKCASASNFRVRPGEKIPVMASCSKERPPSTSR
jgi:Cu+-exporting ATPase